MYHLKRQALAAFSVSVLVLVITAGLASAQDVPSHTQMPPASKGGFDFPAQLESFASLATYSNGIIANVTQADFSNASLLLANYNSIVDSLAASAAGPRTTLDALNASRDDFSLFVKDAKRYNDLYTIETSIAPQGARSDASVADALEMRQLSTTLKGLEASIVGHNPDIYGVAVDNGLDLSRYGDTSVLLRAYDAQVDSRLANVTANAFQTPALTLSGSNTSVTYGDAVDITGSLRTDVSGLNNSFVDIFVDNTTVTAVQTNASGAYVYRLAIHEMPAGAHVARAKYTPPIDAAYNPAESQTFAFSVWNSSVNNTLSFVSGSIGLGRNLEVRGQLRTQNGPVTNATVALALGRGELAQTRTDENGTYAFSVPVNSHYFSAVPDGADVYTVFDPNGQPLDSATSATAHVPANFAGAYAIATTAALALVLGIFLYLRSFGRGAYGAAAVAITPVTASQMGAAEPQPFQPTLARAKLESVRDWNEARDRACEAFDRENDVQATEIIFGRAVALLSASAEVRLGAYTTYSEISSAVQDALPAVRIPLQRLTHLYELVQYGDRSLTQVQRKVAISAFESLRKHAESLEDHR
jgi:hypothetical protein